MRRRFTRVRRWGQGAALVALVLAATGSAEGADPLSPDRLRWSELEYRARKFIFTAETLVHAEVVAASSIAGELATVEEHSAVMPLGEEVVRIGLESSLLGRHSSNTVLLEPPTAAALQATSREPGKRARVKTQRFAADGIAITRRRPADGELGLPEDRWSRVSSEFLPFPPDDRSAPVTDSVALFWVLATAPLTRPGDVFALHLMSDGRLLLVEIKGVSLQQRMFRFDETCDGVTRAVKETLVALELTVDAEPVGPAAEGGDLEFLGMRGSVRILLDRDRRVPLEVSGRVPGAGTVVVRLQRVTLRDHAYER